MFKKDALKSAENSKIVQMHNKKPSVQVSAKQV